MQPAHTNKVSVDEALSLIDGLTAAEQDQVRKYLNSRAWKQRFHEGSGGDSPRTISGMLSALVERLESGNIDEDIKAASAKAWQDVVDGFGEICTTFNRGAVMHWAKSGDDLAMQLETAYQDLQTNLIEVRQAIAQAIAFEKQIELQLQRNEEQAATWLNRAEMATQQNNKELSEQAMQRQEQYKQSAIALQSQLQSQREATSTLRQRLTELERKVQMAYTQKQVLLARDKAAQATTRANEMLSRMAPDAVLQVFAQMEERVAAREASAAATAGTLDPTRLDPAKILVRAVAALENSTEALERMERLCSAQYGSATQS